MKYLDTKQGSVEEAISQAMGGVVAKDLLEAGGKYLKYSDLLLQKGRLMAKGANTAMIDKEISKEMKKLGIKESKDEYEKFFNSALKKFKIDSPADLKTDAKKKEFFNYVDKNYKGKEEETNLEEGRMKELSSYIAKGMSAQQIAKKMNVDVKAIETLMKEEVLHETEIEFDPKDFKQSGGPLSNADVKDTVKRLQKEFPGIKGKKTGKHTIKFDHMGTSDIAKAGGFSVNKLALALDGMGFSLSDKERSTKLRGIRGEYEPDNVDETLDAIREANVAKQKSMREILADIWNMNEGRNPFEKTVKESPFDSKRQLKDPKKETMVMMKKGNYKGQVFVIDKKDLPKFERQGAIQVENKDLKEAPMKNYKYEPNFFVNDKKDTLQKLLRDRRSGYGETELASYLAQKTGKDPEDVYFDDDELVYGSKTIMRGAHKQPIDKLMAKLKTIRNEYEPDMEEGFKSDAQRRAAFASGYKEKGKKKKEEVEKDGKTATGQKPTKVEIEPEVK